MFISEFIAEMERWRERYGDDAEVHLAQQPGWPFEYTVGQIVGIDEEDGSGVDRDGEPIEEAPARVYIGEGEQTRYLPGIVRDELGWNRIR